MTPSEALSRIPDHVLQAFHARLPAAFRDRIAILPQSTGDLREELEHAKQQGRGWSDVVMLAQGVRQRRLSFRRSSAKGDDRLEENYFYGSRRFPALTNNTIGGGGLAKGEFPFFTKGLNDDGVALGFPTGFVLDKPETNMESSGGTIAAGTNFVFNQLGISFNSDIAVGDLAVMLDAVTLNFKKGAGNFALSHGPLKMWPAGMGIAGFSAISGSDGFAESHAATNGSPDLRQVRTLRIPRVLREQEAFRYTFEVARSVKATDGSTIALSAFVIPTIWLFGGQKTAISS